MGPMIRASRRMVVGGRGHRGGTIRNRGTYCAFPSKVDITNQPFYVSEVSLADVDDDVEDGIRYYEVNVLAYEGESTSVAEWSISRRYSHFYALHENLSDLPSITLSSKFPPKSYSIFDMKESECLCRKSMLEEWLQEVVTVAKGAMHGNQEEWRSFRYHTSHFLDVVNNLKKLTT